MFFYNQRTGEWDHVGDNAAELVGPSIADYVGAGGELFVEAAMGDKNGYNKYCYIESPFVEAQGKVK